MNIKRILCPIDFSEFNQAANEYACVLAKSMGAGITYIHASLPVIPFGSCENLNMEFEEKKALKQLKKTVPTTDGVEASYVIEFGSPSDKIVDYAKENEIDLIVIGTQGRTGLRRVLLGSVAEAVVRKADCPVLAIKADTRVPQES